ncbi:UDP-2,4-diacetamido-2,4,6-trideoxy-beta-L-altropyranose hydrolase [Phenylobacterium sp.]|uniref:UDP-2,4-diacetamido-2,4, 6-trideoxy-beta-L-altropyranose hydrolase n=1 Tax=Phenylobacterium sp. TaxID=1871053 RepID=UPI002730FBA0|nr:UDP-2,4-diacetamido-2,4,6-trideoxy-beta-L-altropyranose hydrolase [Phenylobacterium sp.]MDP1599563.1 UDP-2,4-diacetamido-2,4,6-trideoxy-beta-L-altropyranose hydrolase [Phenylobacterium sp.]MDP3595310.1 UDP-2,4-diacetamido-2,4,6-trideoxy-beta-L-altropyranose hydrolase [Phenylobacterium sp.]
MILRPRVLFVANAGPSVGGGHVMRSLSLARALEPHGADCVFLASPQAGVILDVFAPDMAREDTDAIDSDSVLRAAMGMRFDAVVFDHYGLGRAEHEAVAQGRPTLVIDDLADRPLGADLVLDPGPARTEVDYAALAPGARLLLGPSYAPVRPEFAALREQALARRGGPVARVLVALGLTDVGAITARVVDRLRQRNGQLAFDIVLGSASPSLPGLTRIAAHDPRLTLHVDAQDMADLTLNADIAVGGGGSTTWERCTLGLPSLLVVLADNQRPAAQALLERDAVMVVDAQAPDFDTAFDRAAVRLLTDPVTRTRLTAASLDICDGLGADRVAQAFLQVIAAPRETA